MLEQRLDEPTAKGLATAVSRAVRDGGARRRATGCLRSARWPPSSAVADHGERRVGPARPGGHVRTDGRRGTAVADRPAPAAGRYQQALERQAAFRLDLSTGVPDAALLPDLAARWRG